MRNTSRAFLKVGSILGFVFGAIFVVLGIACAIVGKTTNYDLIKPFEDIIVNFFNGSIAKFQQAAFAYGIVLILCGFCSIASGVLCAIARNKRSAGTFITVIVLCALGGSVFGLLGAIFGLIANGQENRGQNAQPQDNQMQ